MKAFTDINNLCGGGALIKSSVKNTKALQQSFILKTNTLINKEIPTNKANSTLTILNQAAPSFSKPLFQAIIPSMLATASILSTPLEAGWQSNPNALTCNSPCQVTGNQIGTTDTTLWISGQGPDLTIKSGATLGNTNPTGHSNDASSVIEVNQYGNVNTITNEGTISGAGHGIKVRGRIGTIANKGVINARQYGIKINDRANVGSIMLEEGSSISGKAEGNIAIELGYDAQVTDVKVSGKVMGAILTYDGSKITNFVVNSSGSVKNDVENHGSITNVNVSGGSVKEILNAGSGKITTLTNTGTISTIQNNGTITGDIKNSKTISKIIIINNGNTGSITNSGASAKIENITLDNNGKITNITNSSNGTINNISLNNNSKITGGITNSSSAKITTISLANNTSIGNITNSGAGSNIGKIILNGQSKISGNITNSGTIANGISL